MIRTKSTVRIGGDGVFTPNSMTIGIRGNAFTRLMKRLFANNEQGFFYDPNDLSTMFQDAAGTVPVTDVGQPVGLIRDKSGRNNHAYQTTSASRPILRKNAVTGAYYLEFDGMDDFLLTANIDFTATDKVSVFAGVRKLSDATIASLVKFGTGSPKGRFEILMPPNINSPRYELSTDSSWAQYNMGASPISGVIGGFINRAATSSANGEFLSRYNGVRNPLIVNSALNASGNLGNLPLYIGRRDGIMYPMNMHLYSLIGIGRLTSDSETITLEKTIAKNTGVTLNG